MSTVGVAPVLSYAAATAAGRRAPRKRIGGAGGVKILPRPPPVKELLHDPAGVKAATLDDQALAQRAMEETFGKNPRLVPTFLVVGIDPGLVNHAHLSALVSATVFPEHKELVFKVGVLPDKSAVCELYQADKIPSGRFTEDSLSIFAGMWVRQNFPDPVHTKLSTVFIETPYFNPTGPQSVTGHRLCMVDACVSQTLRLMGARVVKMDSGATKRLLSGFSGKGHADNKRAALDWFSKAFQPAPESEDFQRRSKSHHLADAALQIRAAIEMIIVPGIRQDSAIPNDYSVRTEWTWGPCEDDLEDWKEAIKPFYYSEAAPAPAPAPAPAAKGDEEEPAPPPAPAHQVD